MKQEGTIFVVEVMGKEIVDREAGNHWLVVHHGTLLHKARPIKAIWLFRRKIKPDGALLKHKARLCVYGA